MPPCKAYMEPGTVASCPTLLARGSSMATSTETPSSQSSLIDPNDLDPNDLPLWQKALGCSTTLAIVAVLIGIGWWIFSSGTGEPDEAAPPHLEDAKENLAIGCSALVQAIEKGNNQGLSSSELALEMAMQLDITPNEILDLLELCTKYFEQLQDIK